MSCEPASKKSLIAWSFYDWAGGSFSVIIQTFVFAAYFMSKIAPNDTEGTTLWGLAQGIAGLFIALGGPILGAIVDNSGRRKTWIGICVIICCIATGLLWYAKPSPDYLTMSLILVTIGIITRELAFVFYSAMLPSLAPLNQIGRWSGWSWGLGYVGGCLCLIISLFVFVDTPDGWLGLDHSTSENIRATFLFAAVWHFVFALPLFLMTPDTEAQGQPILTALKNGAKQLAHSYHHLRQYPHIFRFLVARLFFSDGLTTLFAFGGVYAAAAFQMSAEQVLLFGIALNISAGIGAFALAQIDDRIGGKNMILLSLVGLAVPTTLALVVYSSTTFWILGLIIGIFAGPVQASSRSFLARVIPKELENEMFGYFALSAKATAFAGPLLVSWITYLSGSTRLGLSVVVVFFVVGALIMLKVPDDRQYVNQRS